VTVMPPAIVPMMGMTVAMRGSVMGTAWPTMTTMHVTTAAMPMSPNMQMATTAVSVPPTTMATAVFAEGLGGQ
jgi:hypothetical protein